MFYRLCLISLITFFAQCQPRPASRPKPINPILNALDINHDGAIDASELANAPQALKKLDKNGDGQLTSDEYRPPRPVERGPDARERRENDDRGEPRNTGSDDDHPGRDEARNNDRLRQSRRLEKPRPLLDTALDENGDEIISAQEIAKATTLLKKLDVNGDGRLTPGEYQEQKPQ